MARFIVSLILIAWLSSTSFADDSRSEAEKWDKKYQQLLKDRPDIREKVESGDAAKEDVIAWMKKGGDRQKAKGTKKYYGAKIDVKDPAAFDKADEKVVYSGPQPGEPLPAFKVTGLRGKYKGEEYDPVAAADGKPLVLIFQDNSVVGQKGLLLCGEVLATIAKKFPQGLHVSTTFLVDDPTPSKIFEYDFMHEIDDVIEMSVSHDRRDGPGAYGLNRNIAMTIVVAREGKVLHSFALKQPMLYPDPYVMGAIAEAIGVDRPTLAGWFKKDAAETVARRPGKERTTDKTSASAKTETAAASGQERETRERREYGRGKLAVKDPADFKTGVKQIFSGPQPGEKLPAFKVTSLAGDNKGKELDPITLAGDHPHILIVQDEGGVGIRGLFGVVDATRKIDRKTEQDLQIACVFLCDDVETITSRFAKVFPGLRERGIDLIAVSKDGRDGPGVYGLNRTVSQTIILAKDGKVTRNFVFPQGTLYTDPHVMGGIAELIGEDRETVAGWLAEAAEGDARMRTRGGDDPQAVAKAALREKLGKFVEAGKITREEAGELYQAAFPERERAGDRKRESTERNQRDRDSRRGQRERESRDDR